MVLAVARCVLHQPQTLDSWPRVAPDIQKSPVTFLLIFLHKIA